jgi:hypothetical protein
MSDPAFRLEALEHRIHLDGSSAFIHSTAQLSAIRYDIAAAAADGKVYFGGGTGADPNTVDVYTRATDTWTTLSLPDAGPSVAAAAGAYVVFCGGAPLNIDVYDIATNQFSAAPVGNSGHTPSAVSVGGRVIIAGLDPTTPTRYADIFDAATATWSTDRLPIGAAGEAGAGVGELAFIQSPYVAAMDVYDGLTQEWSTTPYPSDAHLQLASVGPLAFFITNSSELLQYDTITRRVTQDMVPTETLIFNPDPPVAVGENLIFPQAITAGSAIYNIASGEWSSSPFSLVRSDTADLALGNEAFVAGGNTGDYGIPIANASVDIYTDSSPTAVFSGGVAARAKNKATVVLQNSGDADLTGPYTVQVYAIPPGQYHNAILIGSQAMNSPLAAGDSLRFSIPIRLASAPAGTYHLVAMVRAADGALTPFAGATQNFTIGQSPSATPAKPTAQIRPSLNAAPAAQSDAPDTWLSSADEVLR